MSENLLNSIAKDAILIVLKIAGPFLIAAMVIGLIISIFQATTQIQEQTLTFVPKLVGVCLLGLFLGSWILHTIIEYTQEIFNLIIQIST